MAITNLQYTQLSTYTWRITWGSTLGSPTYRVHVDGVLASTQTAASFDITVDDNWQPVVEVLDDSSDPQPAFPAQLVLGWRTDSDAAEYRIEQKVAGVWTEHATVARSSAAYQSYTTPALADQTTHEWRVIPIDTAGNDGTAIAFSTLMVRHPDIPDVSFAYSAGTGKVTISAA